MRIKLDENLSVKLAEGLGALGHVVTTALEEGLSGCTDPLVAATAKAEGAMLFTLDVELADLRRYPPGAHPGIVLFRPRSVGPLQVTEFVLDFARSMGVVRFRGCVVVVDPTRVRVRRPPRAASTADV